MAYDANKQESVEFESSLPKDSIIDGVIKKIDDGIVKDFVNETALAKWQGETDIPAINIVVEIQVEGKDKPVEMHQMFTYHPDGKNTDSSNMGKYINKYGKAPSEGDQVKILTNDKGFGKIKID